jgi:hypothetical protein
MAATKPDIPIGTAKVEAFGTLGPATWANVFYFSIGTFDPAHLDDATYLFDHAVQTFYTSGFTMAYFPPSWQLSKTKVTFRDADESHYKVVTVATATGSGPAEIATAQNAYLVNYVTNDPRKGGKPRTYVPGCTDDIMQDSCNIIPGNVGTITGTLASWLAGLGALTHGTANSLTLEEMSFRNGNTWRDTAQTWPVRGVTLNPVVATQRRRVDRQRP